MQLQSQGNCHTATHNSTMNDVDNDDDGDMARWLEKGAVCGGGGGLWLFAALETGGCMEMGAADTGLKSRT